MIERSGAQDRPSVATDQTDPSTFPESTSGSERELRRFRVIAEATDRGRLDGMVDRKSANPIGFRHNILKLNCHEGESNDA